MNRFYNKLYQFNFQHQFYTDLISSDFNVSPLNQTANWMRVNGLIVKSNNTGFDIVYRQKAELDNDPVIEIEEKKVLPFVVELSNPSILNVTDLPEKTESTDLYIATGSYKDPTLTLVAIASRQPQFTESYTYSFAAVKFSLEDLDDNVVHEEFQIGGTNPDDGALYDFTFSVNLKGKIEQGRYKLRTYNAGVIEDEIEVYVFNRYDYGNLFAIMELEIDALINYGALPYSSQLTFNNYESNWVYKVELARTFTIATIVLTDTTLVDPILFTMDPLVPTFVEGEVISFTASSPIPKKDIPLTKLQLKLNSDETNFTIDKLPNPSNENQNSIVYLKI